MMEDSDEAARLAGILECRRLLSLFSPTSPMIVPPSLYDELAAMPELSDMLDRMQPVGSIPLNPSNEHPENPSNEGKS